MKTSFKNDLPLTTLIFFVLVGSLVVLILMSRFPERTVIEVPAFGQPELPKENLRFGTKTIEIEVAKTNESRMSGLSNRPALENGKGMFFEFDKEDIYSFWMKEMKFPIDIIWLSSDLRVVHIVNEAKPESYPNFFTPSALAQFVLEIPAGFVSENNIVIGDVFEKVEMDIF